MSTELYDRQMAWKKFISRRSDEQGRAILAEACRRRRPPNHQEEDDPRHEERRSNLLPSNSSTGTRSASSNGNSNNSSRRSRGSNSDRRSPASCPPAAPFSRRNNKTAAGHDRAQKCYHPQHERNFPHQPSTAPSYSNMLAARRIAEEAAATTTEIISKAPPEATGGKRAKAAIASGVTSSDSSGHPRKPVKPISPSRRAVGNNGFLQAASGPTGPSNTAARPDKTATVGAAATAEALDAATIAGAMVFPPPPPPRRPEIPMAGRAKSDERLSGGRTHRSESGPTAIQSVLGRPARRSQQQEGGLLQAAGPEHDGQNHRAAGSSAVVVSATRAVPAAVAAVAADGAEGEVAGSDGGENAGRGGRVVGRKPLAVDAADLVRKEQAWRRERAQLLTVIKLQHKQLLRSSETRVLPSPSASSSTKAAKGSGSDITSIITTATATTARSTAPAEPGRPRSGSCGNARAPPFRCPSSSQPSRLETPPPAADKERVCPATPKTSMATANSDESDVDDDVIDRAAGTPPPGRRSRRDGSENTPWSSPPKSVNNNKNSNSGGGGGTPDEQAFVFSTSERSRLLGKVELQREQAARARRLGSGEERGPGGRGVTTAFGMATAAAAAGRASTRASVASAAGSSGSDGSGHGTRSTSDVGGDRGGGGGGGATRGGRRREGTGEGTIGEADEIHAVTEFGKSEGKGSSNGTREFVAAVVASSMGLQDHAPCAPSASCGEGRLQAMERNIEAILRRLGDLERKKRTQEKKIERGAPSSNQGFVGDS